MHSTLIVARMTATSSTDVARLFAEFDQTEMPRLSRHEAAPTLLISDAQQYVSSA